MGRPKLGLALGGGGARGFAHIGVLKVLERENISIDFIVGRSIGALVGAAYAVKPDAIALERRVAQVIDLEGKGKRGLKLLGNVHWENASKSDFFNRILRIAHKEFFLALALFRQALLSENNMRECVEAFIPDIDLTETMIPFVATAVDLISGKQIVLREGSLVRAVMASCAVPGFMPAVVWDKMILVDGALVGAIPVDETKDCGADVTIAVDVGSCLSDQCTIEDGIDTIHRATRVMEFYLSKRGRDSADMLIEPDVGEIAWTDFINHEKIIRHGEEAAELKIQDIRKMLRNPFRTKLILWPRNTTLGLKARVQHMTGSAPAEHLS
jgi:NTE family protein